MWLPTPAALPAEEKGTDARRAARRGKGNRRQQEGCVDRGEKRRHRIWLSLPPCRLRRRRRGVDSRRRHESRRWRSRHGSQWRRCAQGWASQDDAYSDYGKERTLIKLYRSVI